MEEKSEIISAKRGFRYKGYLFFKRAFDIFASVLFLIVFCWLYLIIALIVKLSDGGSVFYMHERLGKNAGLEDRRVGRIHLL